MNKGMVKGACGPAREWGTAEGSMQVIWLGPSPIRKEILFFFSMEANLIRFQSSLPELKNFQIKYVFLGN
jgi:hypothetical protein